MVLNGSFRQDLLLQNYVFNINDDFQIAMENLKRVRELKEV